MNKLLKNTRNTLSISYTVDKENQSGKFLLKLLKDNLPVKVDDGARILVSRKEDGQQFEWKDPVYDDGQIFLDAQNFDGIKQAGTYFIRVILKTGEIFPSSGKCVLKLQKDIKSTPGEFQIIQGINGKDGETQSLADIKVLVKDAISEIPLIKGDKGDKGDPGSKGDTGKGIKNVKYNDGDLFIYYTDGSNDAVSLPLLKGDTGKAGLGIKDVTLVGNTLSVVMDDGTSHQLALPLLKGDPGEKGQDGANVSEITISGNTLFFHYNDGLTYSAQLPLLKGEPGEKGQDAPKISDVSLNGNTLTFTLSDKSTYSVILPLLKGDTGNSGKSAYEIAEQYGFKGTVQEWLQSLKGIKGEKGEPGPVGPKIVSAKFNSDQTKIIFTLSDSSTIEASFTPPRDGSIGKDGVGIKEVSYAGGYLNFTLSDDSIKSVKLELPSGPVGPAGKDAPTITKAEVTNNNLVFTFSDGQSVTAALPNIKGQDGKNAPTITKAEVKDKQLVFTLSDNSTVNVDISNLIKPDMTASSDTAGSTVITGTSTQRKPRNSSVINASLSEQYPVLRLNYQYEPLNLVYDKEYNDLTLRGDTSGNVQSYKIDFSDIYDSIKNVQNRKLDDILFTPNNQKVVLKPNSDQNDALVKFNVQKSKNGIITNEEISTKLNIDTTQLGSGTSNSNVVFYDLTDNKGNISEIPLLLTDFKVVMTQENYIVNNTEGLINQWKFVAHVAPLQKNDKIFYLRNTSATSINFLDGYSRYLLHIQNDSQSFYQFGLPFPSTNEHADNPLPYGSEESVNTYFTLPNDRPYAYGHFVSSSMPNVFYSYFGGVLIITIEYLDFNVSKEILEQVTNMKEGTTFKGLAIAHIQ